MTNAIPAAGLVNKPKRAKLPKIRRERKAGLARWFTFFSEPCPQGIQIMWNSRKCAVLAMAGGGFALASATPASACIAWGYSGAYSHGWPYANTGFASYPAYSYRSCGGSYHIPGWGECGGYGRCGWAPIPPVIVSLPVTEAVSRARPLRE